MNVATNSRNFGKTAIAQRVQEILRKIDIALYDHTNNNKTASEVFLPQNDFKEISKIFGIRPLIYKGIAVSSHPLETIEEIIIV